MVKKSDYLTMYNQVLGELIRSSADALPELNTLIKIISDIFNCPIAYLSLNDDTLGSSLQIVISSIGVSEKSIDDPYSLSCHIQNNKSLVVIEDALSDPFFRNNAFIVKNQMRFCAGCSLSINGTDMIGALCIFDTETRQLDESSQQKLQQLGQVVEGLLRSNLDCLLAKSAIEEVEASRVLSARKQALFNEVAKVSGVGGWEFDVESRQLFWTQQTRQIVGVDDDFILTPENGLSFFVPEAQQVIKETVHRALVSDEIWANELPFINAQGKHLWVKTTGYGIYEDGKLCRVIGSFQDISERKHLEQKMRENERLMQAQNKELSAIMEHIPQGIAVFDDRGLLKYWNSQHLKIYQQSPEELRLHYPFRDFIGVHFEREETTQHPDTMIVQMHKAFESGQTLRKLYHLQSGQVVEALYNQLPDRGWICTSKDITEQEKSREKIHYAAHHDILTGLANRTQFNHYAETEIPNISLNNQSYMLMLIDLDYFKEVNDTYGHTTGDVVLKQVAKRLLKSVRSTDLVCRFGGDEFAILLRGSQPLTQVAQDMAERIVQSIAVPYRIKDRDITIGVSIGLSWVDEQDSLLNEALKRADIALYDVKKQGRNGYRFYKDVASMNEPSSSKFDV